MVLHYTITTCYAIMKSYSFFTLLLVIAFSLTACKSSEMAAGGADGAMATAEEVAADVVEEVASASEENMAGELLAKHLEARGGKDKIKAIQTMTWTAGMEMMGMDLPLSIQLKRPYKMRSEVEVSMMNATVTNGFDGTTAWMINPMQGGEDPQKMPEEAAKAMKEQAAIDGSVMHYIESGFEMNYAGEEMVKEKPAHKVEFTLPEDKVATVYFDAGSFLEVKTVQEGQNPMTGANGTITTYAEDYREVGGVMMAHKFTYEFNGELLQTMMIESIEVNKEIPDSVFEMPGISGSMN